MSGMDGLALPGSSWMYSDPRFPFLRQLASHMPARTQGYPWQLVYSTAVHGSSLKTLYRKMARLDSPVLLVIKDMHKKVCVFPVLLSLKKKKKKARNVPDLLLIFYFICVFRCLGLFLPIHSESANPATAQEKPFSSASTPTSR